MRLKLGNTFNIVMPEKSFIFLYKLPVNMILAQWELTIRTLKGNQQAVKIITTITIILIIWKINAIVKDLMIKEALKLTGTRTYNKNVPNKYI